MSRMTLSDRIAIEAGIYAKLSLKEIARKIRRSPRCVSEEIRRNSTIVAGFYAAGKTDSIEDGIALAAEMIDSGKALSVLDAYIAASRA